MLLKIEKKNNNNIENIYCLVVLIRLFHHVVEVKFEKSYCRVEIENVKWKRRKEK